MTDHTPEQSQRVAELANLPPAECRTHLDELKALLTADSQTVRVEAMAVLATVLQTYPEDGVDCLDILVDRLNDDALAADATRSIAAVAEHDPEAVSDRLPALIALLDAGGEVAESLTDALASLARDCPEDLAVHGIVTRLAGLLSDESHTVRRNAAESLAHIAAADPKTTGTASEQLLEALASEDAMVQRQTARALGHVASTNPTVTCSALPTLAERLTAQDRGVRTSAIFAMSATVRGIAHADDETVTVLVDMLDEELTAARVHASYLLAELAAENPARLVSHAASCAVALVDTSDRVRHNVVRLLATLESRESDVVESARETLIDRLEAESTTDEFSPTALRAVADDTAISLMVRQAARMAANRIGAEPAST